MENFNENRNDVLGNAEDSATNEVSELGVQKNSESVSVDEFISSLEHIDPDDIAAYAAKKKRKSMYAVVKTAMIIVFSGIFLVSAYMIVSDLVESYAADKVYSELNNDFFEGIDRTGLVGYLAPALLDKETLNYGSYREPSAEDEYQTIQTNNPFLTQFKNKLQQYKEKNSDIYGWIQVEGTNISYACVKGYDNDLYLNFTVNREWNVHGSIFADFRCEDNILDNKNLVFYGHNSAYPGKMFHQLTKYLDKTFFEQHKTVTIYTLDGVYKYEIFSIYETPATYKYCQLEFEDDEEFLEWCNEMKENSLFEREGVEFTEQTRILTLSTCTNGEDTQRYSVQARLISVEK